MTTATGLLAVALLGVIPSDAEQIRYDVRIIDVATDDWRANLYRYCTRIGRDGHSTIWTIDEAKSAGLIEATQCRRESSLVTFPRASATIGTPVRIAVRNPRTFVVDVDRQADGPVDQATSVALQPRVEVISEGVDVTIKGNRTTTGVRLGLKIESTWVGDVATYTSRESVGVSGRGTKSLGIALQIPQVISAEVSEDCDVPTGRILLVSLGTATRSDVEERPIVVERLAMIAAQPISTGSDPAILGDTIKDGAVDRTSMMADSPRSLPPIPSRSLLPAIGPDGRPTPLPPLPDPAVETTSIVGPPVPRPSPQTLSKREPTMGYDPTINVSGFDSTTSASTGARLDGAELASGRSQVVRLPIGGKLAIELNARIVPSRIAD